MTWLRILVIALLLTGPALALSPEEILPDPVLEQRARDISSGLRCLVCQNQSIDDSDADLAKDLRLLVRERLVEGDSDDAVRDYIVARYGEYVLLNPVVAGHTLLLWIAAPVLLLVGLFGVVFAARRQRALPADASLTRDEQAALDTLAASERDK